MFIAFVPMATDSQQGPVAPPRGEFARCSSRRPQPPLAGFIRENLRIAMPAAGPRGLEAL